MLESTNHPEHNFRPGRGRLWGVLTLAVAITVSTGAVRAESAMMESASPGLSEAGVPSFVVFGPDSLGFSTAPADLHLLPDGRVLVVSQREMALGDGGRWETFQQAAGQNAYVYAQVAVDDDGGIYCGVTGNISKIELGTDAHWRYSPVISTPGEDPYSRVVQFPDTWIWRSGGGTILAWRPGQPVQKCGLSAAIEHVFVVGNELFASDGSAGGIYQLHFGGDATVVPSVKAIATDIVTCSASYGTNQLLVGTTGSGIRTFDGKSFGDLPMPGILGPGSHINDICRVGADLYAAAVNTKGIVFFDHSGHIVQTLNGTLDHRLARARRLAFSNKGVLWALLENAVACVQFPSPISNFGPLLPSLMNYAKPLRHEGKLWVLADGHLTRGVYDSDGCLVRFETDSPPGRFLWSIAETRGRLFATNEDGVFVRTTTGWQQVAAGMINARLGIGPAQTEGKFFYVARGELGWITDQAGRYVVERFPIKGLGEVYNAVDDDAGIIWLELGNNRLGRVEIRAGEPTVRFFGKQDGLGDGWVNVFTLDGNVHCTSSLRLESFDTKTQRLVEDRELLRRIPALLESSGRPARDASGRLWFSQRGTVSFVDDTKSGEKPVAGTLSLGFQPTEFNMESNGVIWMQSREHLIRYDPRISGPTQTPVQAQITSVQLTASDHHLFTPGAALKPLPYSDNSLLVRFAAVANPFGPPLSFEVMLEGATDRWVSTGAVASASFNRLKEGSYVFHVRPVIGGTPGEDAHLAFTIQPPWFRTKLAWMVYVMATIGLVSSIAWFFSYLERREKIRLEHLVAERTAELNATNAQLGRQVEEITEKTAALAASEERYRKLNADLENRVADRTAELSKTNTDLKREITERQRAEQEVERVHKQLVTASHEAGMAEVATGVLHNVGNVLNSVNVAAGLVAERLRSSKISGVTRLARLLQEQGDGLGKFLTEDPRGRSVPSYVEQLGAHLEQEQLEVTKELSGLILNVDHIKEIVAMQQNYARVSGVVEIVALADLVEDAIKIHGGAYARHGIKLERDFEQLPPVTVDKHKVLQILVNLIHNSKYACDATNLPEKRVTIRIRSSGANAVKIEVADTGVGITPENLPRIFSQGFTTRKTGHGFGLHSAALAAKELGGVLAVHSDGLGCGATFTLNLPTQPPPTGEKDFRHRANGDDVASPFLDGAAPQSSRRFP
jgi:signal transduction histidine kinase